MVLSVVFIAVVVIYKTTRGRGPKQKEREMATYYVEVNVRPNSFDSVYTHFKSSATTAKGITRAASKALRDCGYRTFDEPTTRDIAAVVCGKLAYIIDYQKHGLFQ